MKNTHQHSNTVADVDSLTITELSNTLYHIAQHTEISKQYTRDFVEKCILKASELLGSYNTLVNVYNPLLSDSKNLDWFTWDYETLPVECVPNVCLLHGPYDESGHIHIEHPCASNSNIICTCCEEAIHMCMEP